MRHTHECGRVGLHIVEEHRQDPICILGIKIARGLVGQKHGGIREQGPADRDTLTLALG